MLYATTVAISRPWLGAHYPTDIAVGAAIGVGMAFAVHTLGEILTPGGLTGRNDDADGFTDAPAPPSVRFVFPL